MTSDHRPAHGYGVGHDHDEGHEHDGHDHDVPVTPVPTPTNGGGRLLALPVIAYRRWLSPALPSRCRFYPSCSAYALEALARHGAVRGAGLAAWRVLRCHPFHPGGYDPVPPGDRDATGAAQ